MQEEAVIGMIPYEELLRQDLEDPEAAAHYLNACLEDPDPRVLMLAIRDIADSRGGLDKLSGAFGMSRESVQSMLAPGANNGSLVLVSVLRELGFALQVRPSDSPRRDGPPGPQKRATLGV